MRRYWASILDVFLLVLVRHLNVPAAFFEVNNDLLTEALIVDRESGVDDISDVVLHGPGERAVKLGVDTLHVDKGHLLLEDHLVESADEERVQEASVEDGQTDDTANELEVSKMLRVDARVRVYLESVVVVCRVLEQAIEGVEHFVRKQEKEFTAEALSVTDFLEDCKIDRLTEKDHRNPDRLHHRT